MLIPKKEKKEHGHLVLGLHRDEVLHIGDNIEITRHKGGADASRIYLRIKAPSSVDVKRSGSRLSQNDKKILRNYAQLSNPLLH